MSSFQRPSREDRWLRGDSDRKVIRGTQAWFFKQLRREDPGEALQDVWPEFYEFYSDVIRAFVIKCGVHESDLEDCTQEVWCAVYKGLPDFVYDPDECRFRSWLYVLARNKAADQLRQRTRHAHQSLESVLTADHPTDEAADPSAILDGKWRREFALKVIDRLAGRVPELTYQVFRARIVHPKGGGRLPNRWESA